MNHVKNNYDMIKIDNKLFEQLNTEQFYVYCWLRYRYVAYELNCTTASIDLISNKIQFVKDMTRNKQKIKDIVLKLQHNKIITIEHNGKIKNNTTLEIAFNNMNPAEYTALDYRYVHIEDPEELYIIANIRRWQHVKDKTFSLDEWADMLNVSRPTILAAFERMQEKGLLYVENGEYYQTAKGELRQYNNKYYLVDDKFNTVTEEQVEKEKLEEEQDRAKLKTAKEQKFKEKAEEKLNEALEKITDSRILERDNLIRDGVTMEDEDFYIYVTTDDPLVKELADAKFGRISNSDSGKKFIENSIRKAEKKKAEIEKHKRQQEEWLRGAAPPDSEIHVDEGYDDGEEDRIAVLYKKRKKREEEEKRKEMGLGEK